jgi:hypothetical protein
VQPPEDLRKHNRRVDIAGSGSNFLKQTERANRLPRAGETPWRLQFGSFIRIFLVKFQAWIYASR